MDKTELLYKLIKDERELAITVYDMTVELEKDANENFEGELYTASNNLEDRQEIIMNIYLNFLEQIALYINEGYVDREVALRYFKGVIIDTCREFREALEHGTYGEITRLLKSMKDKRNEDTK
jgi:hypothetical protein